MIMIIIINKYTRLYLCLCYVLVMFGVVGVGASPLAEFITNPTRKTKVSFLHLMKKCQTFNFIIRKLSFNAH